MSHPTEDQVALLTVAQERMRQAAGRLKLANEELDAAEREYHRAEGVLEHLEKKP